MPRVTYNAQSLLLDDRPFWMLAASLHYARIPLEAWADRIRDVADAGFNTIETPCPWLLHEPQDDRFEFDGQADLRRFIELVHEAGMRLVVRVGPYVGDGYDGGGLPSWLLGLEGIALREANQVFLHRVERYFRSLMAILTEYQATTGGPIILFQVEHAWLCSNDDQAARYLGELRRLLQERGATVPLINANDLWQEIPGTIDTWRGDGDLLSHVRQLRHLRPEAPRIVSEFRTGPMARWGGPPGGAIPPRRTLWRLAEILSAGAQPIVSPLHGGLSFGFQGGRLAGPEGGTIASEIVPDAPLGPGGQRTEAYYVIRRLMTFAREFGHIFAELDPSHHPVAVDLASIAPDDGDGKAAGLGPGRGVSVVSQRGPQGRVVFAFADDRTEHASLLLDEGLRMPVSFGDQPVTWIVLDTDLRGVGRLDYANVCPFAVAAGSIAIFHGPAKSRAYLSISGSPFEIEIPSGPSPAVLRHLELTIVVCSREQIDATCFDGQRVHVGAAGIDADGEPIPHPDFKSITTIEPRAEVSTRRVSVSKRSASRGRAAIGLEGWRGVPATANVDGTSPRYASLAGPETLTDCGAPLGYGWYRVQLRSQTARKRLVDLPGAGDRVHLFLDGEPLELVGIDRGATRPPIEVKLARGERTLVALVDNFGRFAEGADLPEPKGLFDHLYEVKALRSIKPVRIEADAVDPFTLRGYVAERAVGQLGGTEQLEWSFTHLRKAPLLVRIDDLDHTGVLLLNDVPIAYHGGAGGRSSRVIKLDPQTLEAFRRGKNVLRFAPDVGEGEGLDAAAAAITLHECVDALTDGGRWSFAKWEPPIPSAFKPMSQAAMKAVAPVPCWWTTRFALDGPASGLHLHVTGLSKGQAIVNGRSLGRYFTATADGTDVGPQTSLFVPASWLHGEGAMNDLTLFDEHGFAPAKVKLTRA